MLALVLKGRHEHLRSARGFERLIHLVHGHLLRLRLPLGPVLRPRALEALLARLAKGQLVVRALLAPRAAPGRYALGPLLLHLSVRSAGTA